MSTRADDEADILRLDNAWNEAYVRRNRAPLADILADDFIGFAPWDDQSDRRREVDHFQRTSRACFRSHRNKSRTSHLGGG